MYLSTIFDITENKVFQKHFGSFDDANRYCNSMNDNVNYELTWVINKISDNKIENFDGSWHEVKE